MILKLGMQHRKLKLFKVYKNDDPGLNLTFFTAIAYTFELGKMLQSHLMGKSCIKGLNLLSNCVNEKTDPRRVVCPGAKCMYMATIFIDFLLVNQSHFHVEPPWEGGKKV